RRLGLMPPPGAYLDECVDVDLSPALHQRGFFVTTVRDEGMTGRTDAEQLEHAAARGLVLVTHNGPHFWRRHLEYQGQRRPHGGIIDVPEPGRLRPEVRLQQLTVRTAMLLGWLPDWRDQFRRRSAWE